MKHKFHLAIKVTQTGLMEYSRRNARTRLIFLRMISINLFYCYEKVLILMNIWMIGKKSNEAALPEKAKSYSVLNIEDITDLDYMHGETVFTNFEINDFDEYHDLYLQSEILLLADIFENFGEMCLNIYQLDPAKFLSTPLLAMEAALKKTQVKLELLTNIDTLLMAEKDIRGGVCNTIHQYAKANNRYMKNNDKNKKSLYCNC